MKLVTDKLRTILQLSIAALCLMVFFDWSNVFIYAYLKVNQDPDLAYFLGNILIAFTGFHSIIASFLFEQFKNMIMTQLKKPVNARIEKDEQTLREKTIKDTKNISDHTILHNKDEIIL
ncbi:hypothetical protein HDV01_001229 [Terramyces sp. JEL0728]|nr:hypothetical protein HDV01_001229 [Terramyces sp. JEL0728]